MSLLAFQRRRKKKDIRLLNVRMWSTWILRETFKTHSVNIKKAKNPIKHGISLYCILVARYLRQAWVERMGQRTGEVFFCSFYLVPKSLGESGEKPKGKEARRNKRKAIIVFLHPQSHLWPKAWDAGGQLIAAAQLVALLYFPWFPYVWGTTAIA